MDAGVSYFGCYDSRHFCDDLEDIAASGFRWVVLPMSEELSRYQQAAFADMVRCARALGLETWIGTWGVAGLFGGEGLTEHAGLCSRSHQARDLLARWVQAAVGVQPHGIFWDEPRTCCGPEAMSAEMAAVSAAGIKNAVCLLPVLEPRSLTVLTQCATVGTDPYEFHSSRVAQEAYLRGIIERLAHIASLAHTEPHLWVRAFNVKRREQEVVRWTLEFLRQSGLDRIGVWGYAGATGMGCLRSEDARALWDGIRQWLFG